MGLCKVSEWVRPERSRALQAVGTGYIAGRLIWGVIWVKQQTTDDAAWKSAHIGFGAR